MTSEDMSAQAEKGNDGSQLRNSKAQPPGDTQATNPNRVIGDGDEVESDS